MPRCHMQHITDTGPDFGRAQRDFLIHLHRDLQSGIRRPLSHYISQDPDNATAIEREYQHLLADPTEHAADDCNLHATCGRYQFLRELGRGGQAQVLLARDTQTSQLVAIKQLSQRHSRQPRRRTAFAREVEIAKRLDHPDLCRVLDHDLDCPQPYAVLEWVPGRTLHECLQTGAAPKARPHAQSSAAGSACFARPGTRGERTRLLHLLARIAMAVHFMHSAQVAHHDLKPANLMVTPSGSPCVIDFGLARDLHSDRGHHQRVPQGTLAYMAPEQWLTPDTAHARADLFALGVITFECVTGRRPFPWRDPEERLAAVRSGLPEMTDDLLPRPLQSVLEQATAEQPTDRHVSAAVFASQLLRAAGPVLGTVQSTA